MCQTTKWRIQTKLDDSNKKNVRKKQRNWTESKVCNNTDEPEKAMTEASYWSYHAQIITTAAGRKSFRHNKVKAGDKQRDASIYLLFDFTRDKIYQTKNIHKK